MFRFVMRTLLVAVAIGAILGEAKAEPKQESAAKVSITVHLSPYIVNLVALTRAIYSEARGESIEGQFGVAQSIINRARGNKSYWCGSRIADVVHCKRGSVRQFDGITDETWDPKDKDAENRALFVAETMLSGTVSMKGPMKDADHYLNASETSKKRICWFKMSLVFIKKIDKHSFYRTPTPSEKKMLAKQKLPEECKGVQQVAGR